MIALKKKAPIPYHPNYAESCTAFKFYESSFEGGPKYKHCNDADGLPVFIDHENESSGNVAKRKRLSTYLNYCQSVVIKYNNFVYVNPTKRDITNARFSQWCKDVDLVGSNLHDFMKRCSLWAQVLGRYYVIADTTKASSNQTQAQAAAAGNRMFLVDIHPSRVVNWSKVGQATTEVLVHFPDLMQVRLYTATTVQVADVNSEGKVVSIYAPVEHGFGFLPVVEVTAREGCLSQLRDIAEVNKSLFNLNSLLMEELYKQTFTTAFVSGVTGPNDMTGVNIGSRKFIVVKPNDQSAQFRVDRMSADVSQAASIASQIEANVNEIYRLAGLLRQDTIERGDRASGLALSIRFNDIALMAGSIADFAEKAENKIIDLYRVAYSDPTVKDSEYPDSDEFETQEFASELKATLDMVSSSLPTTLKTKQVREFSHKFYPDLSAEEQKALEVELKALSVPPPAKDDSAPPSKSEE